MNATDITSRPHEFDTNDILRAIGKEVKTIKAVAVFFLILTLIQGVVALLYVAGALG